MKIRQTVLLISALTTPVFGSDNDGNLDGQTDPLAIKTSSRKSVSTVNSLQTVDLDTACPPLPSNAANSLHLPHQAWQSAGSLGTTDLVDVTLAEVTTVEYFNPTSS